MFVLGPKPEERECKVKDETRQIQEGSGRDEISVVLRFVSVILAGLQLPQGLTDSRSDSRSASGLLVSPRALHTSHSDLPSWYQVQAAFKLSAGMLRRNCGRRY